VIAFPIPVPAGGGPWLGILFVVMGTAVVVVLAWRAVRYFRDHRDDDSD
jgi:hypothetical protein